MSVAGRPVSTSMARFQVTTTPLQSTTQVGSGRKSMIWVKRCSEFRTLSAARLRSVMSEKAITAPMTRPSR